MPLLERASGSVRRPSLASLPQPPAGRTGWPWTEQSLRLPERTPTGGAWPRLTIVTPSLNQGPFIEASIRSILLQGYPDLEYFVIDGGSSDGTREIIAKYAPWIDFAISEPDRGQSSAINRGLRMGSGSHATWINSDDMLCQNALFNLFSHHVLADHVIAVGDCVVIDASGSFLQQHRGAVHSFRDLVRVREVWQGGGYLCQPEMLFPLALALQVGGLNENDHYSMDYRLWGELLLAGASLHYTGTPFGVFRRHQGQKTEDTPTQVGSTLDAAESLIERSHGLSSEEKEELLADLRKYRGAYSEMLWRGSGRLARLGLPRALVKAIRQLSHPILKSSLLSRGSAE
jgi:hypothetical protein